MNHRHSASMPRLRDTVRRNEDGSAAENSSSLAVGIGAPAIDLNVLHEQREMHAAGVPAVRAVIEQLTASAEKALGQPVYHVTAKTTCGPTGDPHDYWSPAPYWWPNPDTPNGLPFVWRDGQRVPGTGVGESGSDQFDRNALQSMTDEVLVLTLAGYFTHDKRYFGRARSLLHTWFISSATRMNPHLKYAQVRRGHDQDQGSWTGLIETKDLHYLLGAVRLLETEACLQTKDVVELQQWFADFREWLTTSRQGRRARESLNNHGTWFDVQVAAIDSYLHDVRALLQTLQRVPQRVATQFEPDGSQQRELTRTLSKHYCAFNLQGWVALAHIARDVGVDVWSFQTTGGRGMSRAVNWLLGFLRNEWKHEQISDFNEERLVVLAHEAAPLKQPIDLTTVLMPEQRDPWRTGQIFTAAEGIRPYWVLGNWSNQDRDGSYRA